MGKAVAGLVCLVGMLLAPSAASAALTPVSPANGATVAMDAPITFAADGTCGSFGGLVLSKSSPATGPNGSLTPPYLNAAGSVTSTPTGFNVTVDPSNWPYAELPADGSQIYWQTICFVGPQQNQQEFSAVSSVTVDHASRVAPPTDAGVTINDGAVFTNDPVVQVHVAAREYITGARLSNDGGFSNAKPVFLGSSSQGTFKWTLVSSGPERLPKTVYARFNESSMTYVDTNQTFTDDIILDETDPEISSADIAGGGQKSRIAAGSGSKTLVLSASDATSGVELMQIGRSKKAKWVPYKKRTKVKASKKLLVRVRDAAGNSSRWVRAR